MCSASPGSCWARRRCDRERRGSCTFSAGAKNKRLKNGYKNGCRNGYKTVSQTISLTVEKMDTKRLQNGLLTVTKNILNGYRKIRLRSQKG